MGKRSFEDVIATARANNYKYGVRSEREEAQSQKIYDYSSKTKRTQDGYLDLYEMYAHLLGMNCVLILIVQVAYRIRS